MIPRLHRLDVTEEQLRSILAPEAPGAASYWEFRESFTSPSSGDIIGFYLSGKLVGAARVETVERFRHDERRKSRGQLKEGVRAFWDSAGVRKVLPYAETAIEPVPDVTVFGRRMPFSLAPQVFRDQILKKRRLEADLTAALHALNAPS